MANQYPKVNLFIENTYNFSEEILSKYITLCIINQTLSSLPNNKQIIESFTTEVKKSCS